MAIETYPVAAAAYPEGHKGAFLTHAYDTETDLPLCKRVKTDSLLLDGLWGGEGCLERKPTCPTCCKRDPRFK